MRTPILFQAKFFFNLLFASALFLALGCQSQPKTVKQLLAEIARIDSLKQIEGDTLFLETWELWFSQPVDHNNPKSERFPHRVIYSHKSFDVPMVVVIEGYKIFSIYASEPALLTGSNQITIEHRFFERSRPVDSIPWKHLNIYQAATDQHKIIQQFKPYYKNKWITTGISKGGQATIYHRYFYPNDVDISIPYVAPLNFSSEDDRVYSFLENVGTPECRERIRVFQEELFKRKERLMPLLEIHTKTRGYTFEFGLSRAYDVNVLEYSFAFWQWSGMDCTQIPGSTAVDVEVFNHWTRVAPFDFIEDKGIEVNRPFFYQAMTEIGMYGYEVETWRKYLDDNLNITFDFTMPKGHRAIFDPKIMQGVNEWVKNTGICMLYIYGEFDPWSATAVIISDKTNAVKFVNPKGDHTTRIKSFPPQMREEIYSTLENWLGQPLNR